MLPVFGATSVGTTTATSTSGKTVHTANADTLHSDKWSIADKINLVTAIATSGYFVATLVLIGLMARANRIASNAAWHSAEFGVLALKESQKSNELTLQGVNAAISSARVAQQQLDSQLLDKYVPIESAIGAALGGIRGSRFIAETMKFQIIPSEFSSVIQAAGAIGGSLHATLQVVAITLQAAQNHRDNLVQTLQTVSPNDPFVKGLRELVELHRRGAEIILEATAAEIKTVTDRLRESTGRVDITLSQLKPESL
jgi:hypothetical protein